MPGSEGGIPQGSMDHPAVLSNSQGFIKRSSSFVCTAASLKSTMFYSTNPLLVVIWVLFRVLLLQVVHIFFPVFASVHLGDPFIEELLGERVKA